MKYLLSLYSLTSDDLLTELDVSHVGPERLARIFKQDIETFVDSYPVGPEEAVLLRDAGIDLDMGKGEYFLEVFGNDS